MASKTLLARPWTSHRLDQAMLAVVAIRPAGVTPSVRALAGCTDALSRVRPAGMTSVTVTLAADVGPGLVICSV